MWSKIISYVPSFITSYFYFESSMPEIGWSLHQAHISQQLSLVSYCDSNTFKKFPHTKNQTVGFITSAVITEVNDDTHGYVGYLPSDQSIYVVFRGSKSQQNYFTDAYIYKLKYNEWWTDCQCYVHAGFLQATNNVAAYVLNEVKKLKLQFP